ncbi:hypothetical protein CW362_04130 [Streptomyces populi]|uniref:Uncharacterized protein n=1 Tax=Streptomyces populi TaxID=2058924 RepID=A0A2I0SW41_9ACTN|nr:hypothetical protein [Streptomyces populi]PKT74157.1 hypothetical protein CW362_04130 [Streptomyces populi]
MHWYFVAGAVLVVMAQAGLGAVALTRQWIPPWMRSRVVRPKLWGRGALTGAVGWSLFMFLGPLRGPDAGMMPYALGGMVLFIAGLGVQAAGQRPGRRPVVPPAPEGR